MSRTTEAVGQVQDRAGQVQDRAGWVSKDFAGRGSWERVFSAPMLAEIRGAVEQVRHLAPQAITRADFPLALCAPLLTEVSQELDRGTGFAVIAGFPVEQYSHDDALRAYCGVAAHLGDVVDQTSKRERLIEVTDQGKPYSGNSRGYHSNKMLPFHTDGAYLAALLCMETAHTGGASLLASSVTVYNEIAAHHPEHMAPLLRGFIHDRRGDHAPGQSPVSPDRIPVFSFHQGLLHCCYNRNGIVWAQDKTGERLGAAELAALDAVDAIVADPRFHIRMDMKRGDMQFVNNFVILHSRTEYNDHADGRRRNLARLWLDCPQGRRRGPTLLDVYTSSERRFLKFEEAAAG